MAWSEEEIDELLVRYLDQELSSDELERFELLLKVDSSLREKLSDWKILKAQLRDLRIPSVTRQTLGPDFANRVIELAQTRAKEHVNSGVAPWISRTHSEATVEAASRLQSRDAESIRTLDPADGRRSVRRRWLTVSAIAASLLAIAYLSTPRSTMNTLLNEPNTNLSQNGKDAPQTSDEPIVIDDSKESVVQVIPDLGTSTDQLASESSSASAKKAASKSSEVDDALAKQLASNPDRVRSAELRSKEVDSSTVSADLRPTREQMQMLEGMMTNPNGMFLFVIDVELAENVTDLDTLRSILDRHDIAWASELEINESIQTNLAKSRMIAEAGKQGLIPDFVDPSPNASKPERNDAVNEVVSLVFVKARGARLDAAIIEVMQQTEEFPAFSFDLAFDPPTHALMNELRLIQEASLPSANAPSIENVSSMIRFTGPAARNETVKNFAAGPRRTKEMAIEKRRQSKLPLDAETMNPIAYALFIVRHAEGGSTR